MRTYGLKFDVDAFIGSLDDAGVRLVALNFAAGDMAAGSRGLVSDPTQICAFRDNADVCAGIAGRTGCTVLNALYGNRPGKDDLAVLNLLIACRSAAEAGATVVIEAVRAEGALNVAFLADLYHLAMMGEDLTEVITSPYIAHIQIADAPGRGAPGTGNTDFETVFEQLAAQGYSGWIGCEFRSHNGSGTSPSTFAWKQG